MKFHVSVICDRIPELEIPQIIDYETVINNTPQYTSRIYYIPVYNMSQ
jgi:hypothetical protein